MGNRNKKRIRKSQQTQSSPSPYDLETVLKQEQQIAVQKQLAIEKALSSDDVNSIMKAQNYLQSLKTKEDPSFKSLIVDPYHLQNAGGYKNKPFSLSYDMLRGMAKTHIIKSIVETRRDQVITFCTPQPDKYSPGFIIQKKRKLMNVGQKEEDKPSATEMKKIESIYKFILECGVTNNFWHGDDFSTFTGKVIMDSLIFDQATFENVRTRGGQLAEFFATDASTYRVADSFEEENAKEILIKGYAPTHVQLYMEKIVAEFYPWELGFGVRNPLTDIRMNGYGKSELEDMIQTVTAILNADLYNANFFKVGSAPKGILRYSGNINENSIEEFRRQWIAQVAGVMNMHKTPIINADKMDFISTNVPNKDMEFSKYQEFLIKISCALYKIDPSEIGFPMSGSSDSKPMFEGNNEARLKYSRDKGLHPLLKKYESWLNKWIVSQLDPEYELRFVGIESEKGEKDELDMNIQKISNFMTVNEVRRLYNLEDIEGGDIILNPTFTQSQMMAQQGDPDSDQYMNEMGDPEEQGQGEDDGEDNPFIKALMNDKSLMS